MLVTKDGIFIEICERDFTQYKNVGYVEVKKTKPKIEVKKTTQKKK